MASMAGVGTIINRREDILTVMVGAEPGSGDIVQEWTLRISAGHELTVLATLDDPPHVITVTFMAARTSLPPAALRPGAAAVVLSDEGDTWVELFDAALHLRRGAATWSLEEDGLRLDVAFNGQGRILGFLVPNAWSRHAGGVDL